MASSEELARLVVKMEANLAEYHSALGKAQQDLRRFERQTSTRLTSMNKQFATFGRNIRNIMGVFGVGFALSGLTNFSKSVARAKDEIALMSKRLETFSGDSRAFVKAEEAARILGVSVGTVADGMTRLLVSGQALGITSKQAQELTITFQQLGRIGGASGEEASRAFIQLTQGLGKGVLQGQDLKSVMSDVPLVAQAIAKELGVATGMLPKMAEEGKITGRVIKDALTNAAEEAKTAFASLPDTLEQQQARLDNAWKKALAGMDRSLKTSALWKFFNDGLTNLLEGIALRTSTDPLDAMQADVNAINKALEKAAKLGVDINKPLTNFDVVGLVAGDAERVVGKSVKDLVNWRNEVMKLQQEYRGVFAAMEKAGDAETPTVAVDLEKLEQAKSTLAGIVDPITKINLQFEIQKKKIEDIKKEFPQLASIAEMAMEELKNKYVADLAEATEQLDRFNDQFARMRLDNASLLKFSVAPTLEENEMAIRAYFDAINQAGGAATNRFMELRKAIQDTSTDMTVFGEQAARNMQDALAQFLFDPFEDGLKGMLKGFVDVLRRMVAEAAAAQIFDLLGGTETIGGFFAGLLGGVPGKAAGGPVSAGMPYMVGERGPELFVPGSSGNIVPNGGMGSVVTYAPVINAQGADKDLRAALPGILAEDKRRLLDALRDDSSRGRRL